MKRSASSIVLCHVGLLQMMARNPLLALGLRAKAHTGFEPVPPP